MTKVLLDNIGTICSKLAYYWILKNSKSLAKNYPQMCCFSYDYIGSYINCFGRFENAELLVLRDLIMANCEGSVALDVGANIGNHTVFFAGIFDKVYAFEPNPITYAVLEVNTTQFSNVFSFMVGASCEDATVSFLVNKLNVGASHIVNRQCIVNECGEFKEITIDVKPIDSITQLQMEDRIDFVKLDVEGNELKAIKGMDSLLVKHMPMLAFEQLSDEIQEGTSAVLEELRKIGYSNFYSIEPEKSLVPLELPAFFRRPLRVIEMLFMGDPASKGRVDEIFELENKNYYMLLASQNEISM